MIESPAPAPKVGKPKLTRDTSIVPDMIRTDRFYLMDPLSNMEHYLEDLDPIDYGTFKHVTKVRMYIIVIHYTKITTALY